MGDIKRLHMLLELDRLGTISAVARSLAYSTSAVSQQLSQLERDFGAALLAPDGRRVRLTAQGEVLLRHAHAVVREWEGAQSAVTASLEEVSGTLAIAAFETACLAVVPPLVRSVAREHPHARVTVVQADADAALERVVARESDLAITEKYPGQTFPRSRDIVETVLFDDPMLLAVPDHLDRQVTGVRDVAELDWVVEMPGSPAREWAVAKCRRQGFEPRIAYESADVLVHHNLIRAGLAVGFLLALTPAEMIGGVRLIDLGVTQSRTVYAASRRSHQHMPLLDAVLAILTQGRPSQ